jgi:hypothetical protein
MKKYIYFTFLFLATIACKAQSPVYDISDIKDGVEGSYYKDLNGVLDGYDGTYLYTNGTTSLKIILKKKVLSKGYYYKDLIVGEFQFIKNGVELNNTIANINVNYTNENVNHIITGSRVLTGTIYGCPDCAPTEKRLRLSFVDKKAHRIKGLDIRKTTVNGVPAIKVATFDEGSTIVLKVGDPRPPAPSLESGDFLMIKQ